PIFFFIKFKIGDNSRERRGFRIFRTDISFLTFHRLPDGLVTDSGHLTDLFDLSWIVVRPKGVISAPKHMHSIGDLEIIVPHPILLLDGGMYQFTVFASS